VALAAPLKGFGDSGAVFRVQRERPVLGTERFDQRHDLTRFVGRQAELQALAACWRTVAGGRRQALLLRGEAGMGKSRLVHEFRQTLAAQGHRTLECRCAPEHSGSAFQPLIDLMRRRLQVHEGDDPQVQLQRLRALQITSGPQADDALALLGSLLSLPAEVLPPVPAADAPERRRQLTMALLEQVGLGLADQAPVCLILEDVHWVDPSTQALMQRLIDGPEAQRVMLLLTQRASAAEPPAFALPQLALAGLDAGATRQLLQGASEGALHDEALLGWLATRADGVPLFIEESARLAAALVQRHPGEAVAQRLRQRVPGSLRDLLAARLDQCPEARGTAQVGAALGRHFSQALIEAVCAHPGWALPGGALTAQLQALVRAGLLTVQPEGGQTVYAFHHALLRDAAHQSLLARDRRRLHGVIAQVLQGQFAPLCQAQPELLAWHQEQAGEQAAAVASWQQAARRATARSAHHEAQGHLRRAQALLAGGAP
jgi:predicted ATPase